jgi:hypothetical protein
MVKKEEYLKAKRIVQEYEKQLNISDVSYRDFSKDDLKSLYENNDSFRNHIDNTRKNAIDMMEIAMISTIRMVSGSHDN